MSSNQDLVDEVGQVEVDQDQEYTSPTTSDSNTGLVDFGPFLIQPFNCFEHPENSDPNHIDGSVASFLTMVFKAHQRIIQIPTPPYFEDVENLV